MKTLTAGVILAAGMSVRFGRPKLLIPIQNTSLIRRTAEACLNSDLDHSVLVLGYHFSDILNQLGPLAAHPRLEIIINPRYHEGKSRSVREGLKKVMNRFDAVMFLVADQPFITSDVINLLLRRFRNSDKDICVPVVHGKNRNPTIFNQSVYSELLTVTGDSGGRPVIDRNPERVLFVESDDELPFIDIDTEDDLRMVNRLASSGA